MVDVIQTHIIGSNPDPELAEDEETFEVWQRILVTSALLGNRRFGVDTASVDFDYVSISDSSILFPQYVCDDLEAFVTSDTYGEAADAATLVVTAPAASHNGYLRVYDSPLILKTRYGLQLLPGDVFQIQAKYMPFAANIGGDVYVSFGVEVFDQSGTRLGTDAIEIVATYDSASSTWEDLTLDVTAASILGTYDEAAFVRAYAEFNQNDDDDYGRGRVESFTIVKIEDSRGSQPSIIKNDMDIVYRNILLQDVIDVRASVVRPLSDQYNVITASDAAYHIENGYIVFDAPPSDPITIQYRYPVYDRNQEVRVELEDVTVVSYRVDDLDDIVGTLRAGTKAIVNGDPDIHIWSGTEWENDTLTEDVYVINDQAFYGYGLDWVSPDETLISLATDYFSGNEPYHYFDFTTNRALYAGAEVGAISNATGYSFARASAGYYTNADGTLTSFASGALRRGDRGVLIEGARTNLLLRSQEFDNAAWVGVNAAVTANDTIAPDGTLTADRITASGAGASRQVIQSIATTATTYTETVFLKQGNTDFSEIALIDQGTAAHRVRLTYATGLVSVVGGSATATVRALANGWFRVSLTAAIAAIGAADTWAVYPASQGSATDGDYCYIWGAQLEAASFPSSYIPTTTASATRAADVLTCTAGVSYPLSLWAEFERAVDTGGNEALITVEAGANDRACLRAANSDIGQIVVFDGGVTTSNPTVAGALAVGTIYKLAARASTDSVQIAKGAILGTEDVSATMPDSPTSLRIGGIFGGNDPNFGYIRRAAIFSESLNDTQLQDITT